MCQTETEEELVMVPTSHEKVLNLIRERAGYGDGNFPEISRRLGNVTHNTLELYWATWQRKCDQDTVHVGMCKRPRNATRRNCHTRVTWKPHPASQWECGLHSLSVSPHTFMSCVSSVKRREPMLTLFTRLPIQVLAQLSRKPYRRLGMTDFMSYILLCTAINPEDAHSIDIRYHKRCWATHVTDIDYKG